MNWIEAIPESALAEGDKKVVRLGEQSILLIRHQGRIFATEPACPHMRLPLKGGKVEDGTLTCPWHHSAFDLETGDVKAWSPWPPAVGRMLGSLRREHALKIYATKVEDGTIWVALDEAG